MPRSKKDTVRIIDTKPEVIGGGTLQTQALTIAPPPTGEVAAPSNLTATASGVARSPVKPEAYVNVTWRAPLGTVPTYYDIEYGRSSEWNNTTKTFSNPQRVQSYNLGVTLSLGLNTAYRIRVRSVYRNATSAWTDTVQVTTADDTTPASAVTNVATNWNPITGDLTITWTNPTDVQFRDARVRIYSDAGKLTFYRTVFSTSGRYVYTYAQNLQDSTTGDPSVHITIDARNWAGSGDIYSTAVDVSTALSAPTITPNATAETSGVTGSAYWTWSAVSGAIGYILTIDGIAREVYSLNYEYPLSQNRIEHGGIVQTALNLTDGTNTLTDGTSILTATSTNAILNWSLVAFDIFRQQSPAQVSNVTFNAPDDVTVSSVTTNGSTGEAIWKWNAVEDCVGYKIKINNTTRNVFGTEFTYPLTQNIQENTTADSSLDYSIVAYNALDLTSQTPTTGTATFAAPSNITGTTVTLNPVTGEVVWRWNAISSGITNYRITITSASIVVRNVFTNEYRYSLAQNIIDNGGSTPLTSIPYSIVAVNALNQVSVTAVTGTATFTVPANVGGVTTTLNTITGEAVWRWTALSNVTGYRLTIDGTARDVFTNEYRYSLAQNRAEHSGSIDTSLAWNLVAYNAVNQVSATATTGTASFTAPATPTGLTVNFDNPDCVFSWTLGTDVTGYRLSIDGAVRDLGLVNRFTYTLGQNESEHTVAPTPDHTLTYILTAYNALEQTTSTTSATITSPAPNAPTAVTLTAYFNVLAAVITGHVRLPTHKRYVFEFRKGGGTHKTIYSTENTASLEINETGSYVVRVSVEDVFGRSSNTLDSAVVVPDVLTLEELREDAIYSDSIGTAPATLDALKDNNTTSGGVTYALGAGWKWTRFERPMLDRYRTVTAGLFTQTAGTQIYFSTSSDNSTWQWWTGPLNTNGDLISAGTEILAQSGAITIGTTYALKTRWDLASIVEARYIRVHHRNVSNAYVIYEFYPRRLIQSDDIEAESILAINIAAGTITGNNIAGNTITATNIAADAITTQKLLVSGTGMSLTDDPNTVDISAWFGGTFTLVTDADSPNGNALQVTSQGATTISNTYIPIDTAKNYIARIWCRQVSGTPLSYLFMAFYDSNKTLIQNTLGSTGWGSGTYHYWGRVNQLIPSTWTEYTISFGPNETPQIPATAKYIRIGMLANSNAAGTSRFTRFIVAEKTTGSLIVDGTITATKIAANTITGDKISSATTITAGTGTNVGVLDGTGTWRIYAGNTDPTLAPFRVSQAGALTATGANITGAITVTGGDAATQTFATTAANTAQSNAQTYAETYNNLRTVVGFTGTIAPASANSVSWNTVVLYLSNNTTITITNGSATGITGIRYISWVPGTVVFTVGTTPTTTVGAVLIAIVQNGAVTANVQVLVGRTYISGDWINTGTITATNIAASTITANEIAGATITGDKIAANTITTRSLLVSGGAGMSITDDPNTIDVEAWSGGSGRSIVTDSTSPSGKALQVSSNAAVEALSTTYFPIDNAKNYIARIWGRQVSGTRANYLTIAFYDSAFANVSSSATGWPSIGMYCYFGIINQVLPSTWTEYSISFGPNETAKIPATARYVRIGVLAHWTGTGATVTNYTRFIIAEKTTGSLIVDGTITATKIAANTITANQIATGAITADELSAGAVTATKIFATAIDGMTITGSTIRTGASGARVVLDSTGLTTYNSSNVAQITATTANNGTLTAAGGEITLNADGLKFNIPSAYFDKNNIIWQNTANTITAYLGTRDSGQVISEWNTSTTDTFRSVEKSIVSQSASGSTFRGYIDIRAVGSSIGSSMSRFELAASTSAGSIATLSSSRTGSNVSRIVVQDTASAQSIIFTTVNTQRAQIDANGFGIGVTPTARNNTTLQLANGIGFPNTQVASSDVNTLDDYEEGTWSPTYTTNGTNFTSVTYAGFRAGRYTKIGNYVTAWFTIATSAVNKGTASGSVMIGGLPFASSNVTALYCTGSLGAASTFLGNVPSKIVVNINDSRAFLYYRDASDGNTVELQVADIVATGADSNITMGTLTYMI